MQVQNSEFIFARFRRPHFVVSASKARLFPGKFDRRAGQEPHVSAQKESGVGMVDDFKSDVYVPEASDPPGSSGWLKLGVLTAASALAGGLAAAWWYRKTLARLRETGETDQNPHFGIQSGDSPDENMDEI
jgi:hypothetical protein